MRSLSDLWRLWKRTFSSKRPGVKRAGEPSAAGARPRRSKVARGKKMETSFENLVEFFDSENLRYQAHPEQSVVIAGFEAKNLAVRIHFMLHADDGLLQLFAPLPAKIPPGCRMSIAEAVVRANYGMKMGKFEFDFADGELRFQIANAFPDFGLEHTIIHRLIGTAVFTVDHYFPAFMSIVYGNELPEDAIRQVEQTFGQPDK
jgi:hypothetical protein